LIYIALAVLVATGLGVYVRQRWGEPAERATARGLDVLVWVVLPPLTYLVVAHLKIDAGVGLGILMAYAVLTVVGTIAYLVTKSVLKLDRPSIGATINGCITANTGYLGVPLAAALIGHYAIGSAVAFDAAVNGTVFTAVALAVGVAFGTKAGESAGQRVRTFLVRNPVLLAAVLGLLAPDALAPQELTDIAKSIYALILPIGFFMLGVYLTGEREDGTLDFPPRLTKPIALIIGLRLVVAPALMLAGSLLVDLPDAYLLQAAMPTGIISIIAAHLYGLNLRLAAAAVAWTTTIVVIFTLAAAALN
jgi:malate permease and related proteins